MRNVIHLKNHRSDKYCREKRPLHCLYFLLKYTTHFFFFGLKIFRFKKTSPFYVNLEFFLNKMPYSEHILLRSIKAIQILFSESENKNRNYNSSKTFNKN